MSSEFNPFSYKSLLRSIYKTINYSNVPEDNSLGAEKRNISDDIDYKTDPIGLKYLFTKPKNPEEDQFELSDYIGIFIFMIIIALCAASG